MKKIIIGNWKLNLDHLEAIQLLQKINYSLPENIEDKIEIILSPSFTSIRSLQTVINSDKLKIKLSSQNVSQFASGAYTGEVSATQLKKLEIDYGIVGHSERRTLFNEIDLVINDKVNRLIENDIVPVFCFGEPIEERKSGSYYNFIENPTYKEKFKNFDIYKTIIKAKKNCKDNNPCNKNEFETKKRYNKTIFYKIK